jgi:hypothetical protein
MGEAEPKRNPLTMPAFIAKGLGNVANIPPQRRSQYRQTIIPNKLTDPMERADGRAIEKSLSKMRRPQLDAKGTIYTSMVITQYLYKQKKRVD